MAAGNQTFTTNGTFTVPADVYKIDICMIGGGGSGCAGEFNLGPKYGGGGYAGEIVSQTVDVTPSQQIAVTIGSGGASKYADNNAGSDGSAGTATSFGAITASGGLGGLGQSSAQQALADFKGNGQEKFTCQGVFSAGLAFLPLLDSIPWGGEAGLAGGGNGAGSSSGVTNAGSGTLGAGGGSLLVVNFSAEGNSGAGGNGVVYVSWDTNKLRGTGALGDNYSPSMKLGTSTVSSVYHGSTKILAAKGAAGSETFTTSGVFTVPDGYGEVTIKMVGGGGSGASSDWGENATGGGYAGQYVEQTVSVIPGERIDVKIAKGGVGASSQVVVAGNAGESTFFGTLEATGGSGGSLTPGVSVINYTPMPNYDGDGGGTVSPYDSVTYYDGDYYTLKITPAYYPGGIHYNSAGGQASAMGDGGDGYGSVDPGPGAGSGGDSSHNGGTGNGGVGKCVVIWG